MALSSYLEAKLLDLIFSNTAYTVPGTLYVSLGQQTAALTTALTAGTPVTSLACTGTTTHALANGDIVLIGTSGEQAVVSGTVNAGSTSITINSFTPCKSYATGTSIVKVSGPVEPAGNGYARVAQTNNATNWPAATGNNPAQKSNGTAITFPQSTGSWFASPLGGFGIHDALTAGNLLAAGYLATPVTIAGVAPPVSFPANQLVIAQT